MAHLLPTQHFQCQLEILKLKNLDITNLPAAAGKLFIRCYIWAGDGRRIRIDMQELPSTSSLECRGASNTVRELLEEHGVVFELRWRRHMPMIGKFVRSKLLGRAQVAWKDMLGTDGGVSRESLVTFAAESNVLAGLRPPALLVRMDVRVSEVAGRRVEREGCGCRDCEWVGDQEDMFAAAAAVVGA